MTNAARIAAYAGTMRHIVEGLDIVGEDIAEMGRRLRKLPRKGHNAKAIESELGIYPYRRETILISLHTPSRSNKIIVLHKIGDIVISVTVDDMVIVRAPFSGRDWEGLTEAAREGFTGRPLGSFVDMSETSIPEIGEFPIHSLYHNRALSSQDPASVSIYVNAPVTAYQASVMKDLKP